MDDIGIDFEAIDQAIERHKTRVATEEKVKNVAKAQNGSTAKKTTRKPAKKKTSVKPTPKTAPKPALAEDDSGEAITVKIKAAPKVKPAPKSKPNPRTGKYLDLRNPNSDMTVSRVKKRTISVKLLAETTETPAPVAPKKKPITIQSATPSPVMPPTPDDVDISVVSDNITVGDAIAAAEQTIQAQDIEAELAGALESLTSDGYEEDLALDGVDDQPFLDKIVVEKRPLSGGEPTEREIDMRELLVAEETIAFDPVAEREADAAFVSDKPNNAWMDANDKAPAERPGRRQAAKQAQQDSASTASPTAKKVNVAFYILLVLLLVILGGAIGALLYFSDIMSLL